MRKRVPGGMPINKRFVNQIRAEIHRQQVWASVDDKALLEEFYRRIKHPQPAETAERNLRMYARMLANQGREISELATEILKPVYQEHGVGGIIVAKDIRFSSMCEHHLLPFSGYAHIAYMPRASRIVGLSKLPRIVDACAARLQLQERLAKEIAQALWTALEPDGVAVWLTATHGCVSARGVLKHEMKMVTSEFLGRFATDVSSQQTAFNLIQMRDAR